MCEKETVAKKHAIRAKKAEAGRSREWGDAVMAGVKEGMHLPRGGESIGQDLSGNGTQRLRRNGKLGEIKEKRHVISESTHNMDRNGSRNKMGDASVRQKNQ